MSLLEPREVYYKLEKALDIIEHEGHEPRTDLYAFLLTLLKPKPYRYWRMGIKQAILYHRREILRTASNLGYKWKRMPPISKKGMRQLASMIRIDPMSEALLQNQDIDPLSICFNLLNPLESRLKTGAFFTPPPLAQFIAQALQPQPGDRVIDPASGTGVFLQAMRGFTGGQTNIWGIEMNPELCTLSSLLVDTAGDICSQDALDRSRKFPPEGTFDIVFVNPPFGFKVDDDNVSDCTLSSASVGHKSEVLFVERAIRLARRMRGKIALLLSEEMFVDSRYSDVLEYIEENTQKTAELRLPRTTFAMCGIDLKTRLLFLKRSRKGHSFSPVSYDVRSIGIDKDGQREQSDLYMHTEGRLEVSPEISGQLQHLKSDLLDHNLSAVAERDLSALPHDWDALRNVFLEVREANNSVDGSSEAKGHGHYGELMKLCSEGVIRDLVIDYLDLGLFNGLDGDLLEVFSGIGGNSLEESRRDAYQVGIERLKNQVRKGNTFFFDVTKMRDAPELGAIVATILDARTKQVLTLEKSPPLADVYSTYYGFKILTVGSLGEDAAGFTDPALQKFSELAFQIGREVQLDHRQLKYSKQAFGRVTDYTRNLLWNILSVCASGINRRTRAIRELGALRDSRALGILHLKLTSTRDIKTQTEILGALGQIGHTASILVLERFWPADYHIRQSVDDLLTALLKLPSASR